MRTVVLGKRIGPVGFRCCNHLFERCRETHIISANLACCPRRIISNPNRGIAHPVDNALIQVGRVEVTARLLHDEAQCGVGDATHERALVRKEIFHRSQGFLSIGMIRKPTRQRKNLYGHGDGLLAELEGFVHDRANFG